MKKFLLLLTVLLLTGISNYSQERIRMHFAEFVIPYSQQNKKSLNTVDQFEQKPTIALDEFKKNFDAGVKNKTIKILDQGSREISIGQNNIINQGAEIALKDDAGNVLEKRPSYIFSIAPWIMGEEKKPYISFDLLFMKNQLEPASVQNHDIWWRLNFSKNQNTIPFNAVIQFGGRDHPWDEKKSQYHSLCIYFEK